MKKLMLWFIALLILTSVIFYRLGRQDLLIEIRQEYPHLYNFKKKNGCCRGYEIDDIWITDSARVHLYTKDGWKKLN